MTEQAQNKTPAGKSSEYKFETLLTPNDDPRKPGFVVEDGEKVWFNPPGFHAQKHQTLAWMLADRVRRLPNAKLLDRKTELGGWRSMTATEFNEDVHSVARGLIGMGLQPGDRFSIMGYTSYEWMLIEYAGFCAGLTLVPIYETDSTEQIAWILEDADPALVVTETAAMRDRVNAAKDSGKSLKNVLCLEDSAVVRIKEAGGDVPDFQVVDRSKALTIDDLAMIVYTSGTVGKPKGVELTHGNWVELMANGMRWMPEIAGYPSCRLLVFLPLAHVLAQFLQLIQVWGQGTLGHAPNIKNLLADLQEFAPSYVMVVPRVLEKIYNSAQAAARGHRLTRILFARAVKVAESYSRALDTAEGPSRSLRARRWMYARLVYGKILALFGPNMKFIISGGAPLSEDLGHFYRGIGMPVLEGYGLTETCAPMCFNSIKNYRIGTVGPGVSSLFLKVSEAGELMVKGPSIFKRYHNNPEQTAAAFDGEWFKTGDLATIDEEGFVRITGRAKDIIVTAGGKNVAPSALEDPLRQYALISEVMVVGEGKPFVSALITLDPDMLPGWLKNHGLPSMDVLEASRNPDVLSAISRAVERVNARVSRAESIRKFKVLPTAFTVENGLLTPSLKVKRKETAVAFAAEIEDLYASKSVQ
ncbi:MAG: AMP-dependent synthetase/ligase [Mobiluncus porci]|uniref:AMP-dependent synthetase/ligase n=1 Tax=Mobiluncus sp. TaxID=47293 RepID=UPI0023F168E4|nr:MULTISPECIES: AMP-dependent synthetase/ligase [Mobiluncus]MCI6584296.1 AMP-dependent synthetase/ligase [Mobiluncus sp.]MDD7540703.1 AMP-dependent synthetase/ligase [Mobiluncus porci]MDY5748266.1 AMP-dependent synthetase/ligase [Mobiluncus porci]